MSQQRINEINQQIEKLTKEREQLEAAQRLPELQKKIQDYLNRSYSGKKLLEKHSLNETGFWKIKGEDPNCDLGGSHIQPDLGTVQGTLQQALEFALDNPNFYTWGGGGDIEKINVIIPQKH